MPSHLMDVIYIPEFYFYLVLIVGILSSVFMCLDLYFRKKKLARNLKLTWLAFALLLAWGPSFFLWIIYELKYRGFGYG